MIEEKENRKDLEKRIYSMECTLRAYRTEKEYPDVLRQTMDFHKEQLLFHRKKLEVLEARIEGYEHIDGMKNNIYLAKRKLHAIAAATAKPKRVTVNQKIRDGRASLNNRFSPEQLRKMKEAMR